MSAEYESDIQADILDMVKNKFRWFAHKNTPGVDGCPRGWPDVTVYVPGGRPVMIEFKRPGEQLSQAQRYITTNLIKVGYAVYSVDNVGHAYRVLKKEYERGSTERVHRGTGEEPV